jgi:hypothetical protein
MTVIAVLGCTVSIIVALSDPVQKSPSLTVAES